MQTRIGGAACLLIAVGLAAYANSFAARFTGLDARESIRDNPHIRQLWPLSEAMSLSLVDETLAVDPGSKGGSVVRRPLLSLTFALNYHFLGPEARGFQAVNIAIHLCAGLLLFGVVRRTLALEPFGARYGPRALGIALAAAAIWIAHPLQTESVTYIVQRAESLMGFFYLLTLYCAMRGLSGGNSYWYAGAVGACALGMATKETMSTVPIMVLLYDIVFISPSVGQALRRHSVFYAALAATWAIPIAMICATWDDAVRDFTEGRNLSYALAQLRVLIHYLRLSVWPHPLHLYVNTGLYLFEPGLTPVRPYVLCGLILAALLSTTLWGLWQRKWFGFLGAWFFLILAPSSSFVAASDTIQEHRMYLSLAAVVVLGIVLGDLLLRRLLRRLSTTTTARLEAALVALLVAALIATTRQRNRDYLSEFGPIYPGDRFAAQTILANHELARGNVQNALDDFEELLASMRTPTGVDAGVAPASKGPTAENGGPTTSSSIDRAKVHYDFANSLCRHGYLDAAARQFELAIEANPLHAMAHNNLGALRALDGKLADARAHLQDAIRIRSSFPHAYSNLGLVSLREGDLPQARTYLAEALRLAPGFEAAQQDLLWLEQLQRLGKPVEPFALAPAAPFGYTDVPIILRRVPATGEGNGG